jgi:hypothetical protein
MSDLRKKIEAMLSAITFAEGGEFGLEERMGVLPGKGFPTHIYKNLKREGDGTMEEKGMFGGFDPTMMIEDVLKLMRFSFDVAFDNVMKVQDFNVKLLKDMLEKSKDVQADTLNMVFELIESVGKVRDEYKKMITEGLDKVVMLTRKK